MSNARDRRSVVDNLAIRTIADVMGEAWAQGRQTLLDHEAFRVCGSAGLPLPSWLFVPAGDATPDLAPFGDEIVVKGVAPGLLHKTEAGAVQIVRACADEVGRTVEEMWHRIGDPFLGVLLVEKVSYHGEFGLEMLISSRFDEAFGPVIAFGVRGIQTEYFNSVAFRAAEGLTRSAVRDLLGSTAAARALRGELRGQPARPVRLKLVEDLVLKLTELARVLSPLGRSGGPYLRELEFNPVVISTDGRLAILDALVTLTEGLPTAPPRPPEKVRRLLKPSSALVIGASGTAINPGRIILNNLQNGGGIPTDRIWCLHPKASEIDGSVCYRSLAELPEAADMAVVAIPASGGADEVVAELVRRRKAHSVTLISGGLGETAAGRQRERELKRQIQGSHLEADGGVVVNGGNCLGIVSKPGGYNTFFLRPYKLRFSESGASNLASISQSGAYLVTQASNLENVVSPRYSISFGNQVDLTVSDYLAYLKRDSEVRVFCVYLEGFQPGDGIRLLNEAREIIAEGRPVLLYKAGRSEEGSRAARSHTAAMAGDYVVTKEVLSSAGVVVVESLDELGDLVKVFCLLDGRPAGGMRVGVLSNAGFEATAAADNLHGMTLAEFSPETRERLRVLLPSDIIDVHNPVDATPITNSASFAASVQELLDDANVDLVVASLVAPTPYLENLTAGPDHSEDITRPTSVPSRLISVFRSTVKPIVVCVDSGPLYTPGVDMMQRAGIPCFRKIDRATRALASYARFFSSVSS
jgi:acyl-CoA synthetase (NDP forming)